MNKKNRGIGIYIIVLLILIGTSAGVLNSTREKVYVYSDVVKMFEQEQVKNFSISGTTIALELRSEEVIKTTIPSIDVFLYDVGDLIKEQRSEGIIESQSYPEESGGIFMMFLPYIIIMVVMFVFWFFQG